MKYRILCTDGFGASGREELERYAHLEVIFRPTLSHEELLEIIESFDGLIVRSASNVGRDVIERGTNLKLVARAGVGTDNIDLAAATERGILVVNAPAGNTTSTAELAFAMLLSLARKIPQAAAAMADGRWEKKKFKGTEVAGKTLGIIGMGRIGREVARRALAFQMKVIASDPYLTPEQFEALQVIKGSVEDICKQADYITVHTPLTAETENLITARELALMKPTTRIINCARGGIINEQDLADALGQGTIAGAALDVFTKEPYDETWFQGLENCVLTPHLGASTEEAQDAVAREAAAAVAQYFEEGLSANAVNLSGIDQFSWKGFKNYLSLAEKLGSIASQLCPGGISKMTLISSASMPKLLTLAALKGIFLHIAEEQITFVNAEKSARDRGIVIAEEILAQEKDFAESFGVRITSTEGAMEAWGVILPDGTPKIVRLGEYRLEIDPVGPILFIHNYDRPGVIGRICTVLGEVGVNIAEMQNVRSRPGEKALTVIGVDQVISKPTLQRLAEDDDIMDVKLVRL